MDCHSGPASISCFPIARKKRSNFHRRPHPDPKTITKYLNVFTERSSPTDYGGHEAVNLHCSNGNLNMGADFESCNASHDDHNRSNSNKQGGNENKLRKLKLKLGGITHTLHTTPTIEIDPNGVSGAHLKQSPSSCWLLQHILLSYQLCQEFSRNSVFNAREKTSRRHMDQNSDAMYKPGHKSKRATKKFYVDEEFDDEDDEEIRYLKKLRASKAASGYVDKQEETGRKNKGITTRVNVDCNVTKDGSKKSKLYKLNHDYEMELSSDDELKGDRKRLVVDCVDPTEPEMTMTTRKRALDYPESGGQVEFPNGLPSAPSKKQKLSEVDQQLRKAEAAQRRRSQAEKAAKEAEAEAIRKILGHDSSRKKEEKLKKQQEALAQEKLGKTAALGPNTVRWIMGPHGTVVTFSEDMGLPKILDSMPCRYPPPREKCVGPNCTNDYKYRDSKSKLPLCSLHCYKAVRGNMEVLPAC